jgi:putative FmdB family regulatory protein
MPTYDYKCSDCGTVKEVFQKMSDEPLTTCPECGGAFKRIITSVGIIFKGSGFHINDYRGNSGGAKEASDSKSSDAADSKSDSKADGGDKKESSGDKKSDASASGKSDQAA